MKRAPRNKWVCRTFPHRLAQDLKEELRDQIREGVIQTEQACLQWLEDEERVDAPNQKLEDLWSIPLPPERGELRVRDRNRYIRKYRRSVKLVEDWNEASEFRHLLKDVLPGHWKRRVEDEEKKRAKKRVAVQIMASEDTHARIMEFSRRNLGEPSRMLGLKNAVYVEVFGDTMGQRLMRLNNVEWRRGEQLRMQVIFARMSLDEIVKYITVELKLNAKNEAHVQDRQGQGHRGHREDRHHREVKGDTVGTAEEGSGSGQDLWTATTPEDHEEAHFFVFVAQNMKENGQDRSRWNRLDPRTKNRREPRRIGNPPLSFREYRSQHTGCWVCCGRPCLEDPPGEWDLGGLSSENQPNSRESEGTPGAKEGSRRAKTTEFRHSQPLERPAKGSVCGQGTWQEGRSEHGEPRGRAGPAQDLHHP